jgi:endonuclease YncB( thermonuclease family)
MRRATRKIVPFRRPARRVRRAWWWRWRGALGAEQRAAVVWFLALAAVSGGYGAVAPALEDWRASRLPMTRDCRVSGVVDGDTVNLFCVGRGTVRARIVGYDTPELFSPRCAAEAAERARQALATWAWHATSTEVAFLGRDRYGRGLVEMRLSGQRVAAGMVGGGYGRRYLGHLRGSWC